MPDNPTIRAHHYQFISLLCASFATLTGVAGLCGWLLDNDFLRTFFSDGATMKINTILLLILGGAGLMLFNKGLLTFARVMFAIVILLSLAIITEHLFNLNLYIDEFWLKDRITNPQIEAPGRTSLLTALDALWIGTSMLLLSAKKYRFSQLLASCVFIIVYLSLVGHLFHIAGFYRMGRYSGVAFHTALGLLLLAIGTLVTQARQGWIGIIYERLKKQNLGVYFLSYFLGAAPLLGALYLFIIQRSGLSPASDIVVLVILTALLSSPVAYFLLKLVNRMGDELKQADTQLQIALDAAQLGSYDLDLATGHMNCSAQCKKNFGLPAGAVFNYDNLIQAITPAYRKDMQAQVKKAIDEQGIYQAEYQVQWPDGSLHWISASGKPQYDAEGNAVSIIGVTADISDRENYQQQLQTANEEMTASNEELATTNEELIATNEELIETQQDLELLLNKLAASEHRFRNLVKEAPVAIHVLKGPELITESANDQMLKLLGKKWEDMTSLPYKEALPEMENQPYWELLQKVYATGETYCGNEAKVSLMHDGRLVDRYFNFIYQPIKDEDQATYGIMIVATEVTDLVISRKEREQAEEKLRLAIEAAKIGSWHIEPISKALRYNPVLAQIFGYEGAEPMTYDQAIGQVTDEHRIRILQEIEKAIANGENYDITYTQRRFNDGEVIWLRSIGKITQDEEGQYTIFSGVVMDITEQKKDDLRKNDFIGMVSHELKTPLTSLSAIVQMANAKLKSNPDQFLAGAMEKATLQVKKMSTMINGFLNVSRLESGKLMIVKQDFSIDELIKEAINENELSVTTHIIQLGHCDKMLLYGDRDKIGSVISNFLSNAIKYSPKGDRIEVSCQLIGNQAQVSVKDQGMGIKPQDLDHVFDRYYRVENTSMQHISGFGIGLYLSAEIIRQHDGKIWVESKTGEGSTFFFSLPLHQHASGKMQ